MTVDARLVPEPPPLDAALPWAQPSLETLALLSQRRSTKIIHLIEPGPTPAQLEALLRLAMRAPDHGKLAPWRFLVIEEEGRARAGEALARVIAGDPGVDEGRLVIERERFLRSPLCVTVISTAQPHPKIPEWEQQLSAGVVCFQLLLAAHAMGYGGCWLTGWACYDARARSSLGLIDHERIAGFIHLGSADRPAEERPRPSLEGRVSRF